MIGNSDDLKAAEITAQTALLAIEDGEREVMLGWVLYGEAMLVGRRFYPSDEQFGQWLVTANLAVTPRGREVHWEERVAAMWAAEHHALFEQLRDAHPRVRTLRGIYKKAKQQEEELAQIAQRARTALANARRAETNARRLQQEYEELVGDLPSED